MSAQGSPLTALAGVAATVATGGAAAPLMLALTAAQTGMSLYAQKQSQDAAATESKQRQQLLKRKADSEKSALRKNASLKLKERQRTLAQVRAQNAARGFAESGTQLAVFGEIGSRIDEQIDEATNRGLDRVASYRESARMEKFAQGQRDAAGKIQMASTVVSGVAKGFQRYGAAKKTYGSNESFSIF